MSDDVDEQLRRAMKVLDDQVPSGYFEGLPQRTLARLEDNGMQTSSDSSSNRIPSLASVPPMSEKTRDEDSGLHDIRSLASSAKARLSSRRSTAHPVASDDDILASSSAGWKAVALPEPAKMVSLPELATLPSKSEVEAADRAARAQLKAELKAEKKVAGVAAPAVEAAAAAPAASMADAPSIGSRISAKQKSGKGATYALVGIGVAAAAGVGIYFATASKDKAPTVAAATERPLPKAPELTKKEMPTVTPVPAAEPPPPAPVEAVAAVAPVAAAETEAPEKTVAKKDPKEKVHKVEIRGTAGSDVATKPAAPTQPKEEVKKGGEGEGGEPSFDALLKEAGVSDQKKEAKPVLDKKSLSGSDIKTGMGSVQAKAMGCYAGTQGTAAVKLTVAPTGKVSKVTVTGVFANTPVGTCVENAVKSATFPPWDGGPQSIAYSYLLAE